jgi:hypothetical protein
MRSLQVALLAIGTCAGLAMGRAQAQSILVLNGIGPNTVTPSLNAAGFNVIEGTLDPDQIANNLAAFPDIVEIWIWNDGTFGNTGSPAEPARDFSAADLSALEGFLLTHPHWIMDGLAWRGHVNPDEVTLSMNEAIALANAGGGIVLGADDSSGDAIVQHVNQVAQHFGMAPFFGVLDIAAGFQHQAGTIFNAPFTVDPTGISSTFSYCDVPNGLQPNGRLLATALFADMAIPDPSYPSGPLTSEVFDGVLYVDVAHLVTTTLPGGGFSTVVPYCFGDGSGGACPCGNFGSTGAGCDNSFGTGGGLLGWSGVASVSADSFELDGSAMPPSAPALYFQGTLTVDGTQGAAFGDGLRCVGGMVTRLGTRSNVAGASGYGAPLGDIPISVRGGIQPGGGTYFYQAWYRNAASFCTPDGYNLTNGIAVTWQP